MSRPLSTIVVAAGSWSSLVIHDGPPVSPVRGQLVRLRWQGPPIGHVLWRGHSYIVPWLDGTLLVGATMEVLDGTRVVGTMEPRMNFYPMSQQPVPTPDVRSGPLGDLYLNLKQKEDNSLE